MKFTPTALTEVVLIEAESFADSRGFFYESYNARDFRAGVGIDPTFVQDDHSRSNKGVLRGLHYQICQPQGKIVRVTSGEICDVVVDIRKSSPTFGRHIAITLAAERHQSLWIPPGFAHGFLVLSDSADVLYKVTDFWAPEHQRCIRWDDPTLNIAWPLKGAPNLSEKDARGALLDQAEVFA